jgi:tetratricopeptide (TPR) repeat protein
LRDGDRVADEASAALASDPADERATVALARARWGVDDDAERLTNELLREAELRDEEPALLAALGDTHFSEGRYAQALPLHNRAQTLEPADEDYGIKLAATLAALRRPEGVYRVLRNIRSRGVLRPEAWLLLGDACLTLGNRPCALAAEHRVAALTGDQLGDWLRRELPSLAPEGPGPLALELLGGGLASAPTRAATADATRAENRGWQLRQSEEALASGRSEAARAALEALYRSDPLDLEVALAYARNSLAVRDLAAVRETLALVTELLLASEGGLDTGLADGTPTPRLRAARSASLLGTGCWEAGDYWNALHAYLLGEILVPDDPRFPFNIGLSWERIGDLGEALAAFERTLELEPGFPRASEHRQALAVKVRGHQSR